VSSYEAFSSRILRVEVIYRMQLSVVINSKMSNFTIIVIFQCMLRPLLFHLNCVIKIYLGSFLLRLTSLVILEQSNPGYSATPHFSPMKIFDQKFAVIRYFDLPLLSMYQPNMVNKLWRSIVLLALYMWLQVYIIHHLRKLDLTQKKIESQQTCFFSTVFIVFVIFY